MNANKANHEDIYSPSSSIVKKAKIRNYEKVYEESIRNREKFWEKEASHLHWYKKWNTVLDDSNKPFYKWFTGAKTNIVANAIDRHLHS